MFISEQYDGGILVSIIDNIYASKGLYQQLLAPVCKKYNLTDSELVILLFLASDEGGDTATDIVLNQRLKKSVVSGSLKDLQDRGFISCEYLDGNRRSVHLKLKDDANEVIEQAMQIQKQCYEILTDGLSKKEKENLKSYLEKVNDNIRKYRQ